MDRSFWAVYELPNDTTERIEALTAGVPADAIRHHQAAALPDRRKQAGCEREPSRDASAGCQRRASGDAVRPGVLRLPGRAGWQAPDVPLLLVSCSTA